MTLKALVLNCTLKKSSKRSNTLALVKEVTTYFNGKDIETEILTLADFKIGYGITHEAVDADDQWPEIFEKVKEADILIIASPIWLGSKAVLQL